jgi:DnaJ-class molecular chaperone
MDEDYYKTLGVSRNASQADIQKAYRDLARKYHPDLNPDDAAAKAKFQAVQRAYEVLNDSNKREMYDRYGSSFESMGGGGPGGPGGATWRTYSPGEGGFEDFDFSQVFGERFGQDAAGGFADLFKQFTGAGGAGPRTRAPRGASRRGADLRHELKISFATAINGGQARLSLRRAGGKTESIDVKIPAGIADGKKIRLKGQGEAAPQGGTPGDILITVRVAPHPCFQRRGQNLELKVPVTLAEAVLGASIDVPTPRGTISLKIPPNTSSGKRLRVKGHGVPGKMEAGDLYAEVQIVLPESLDDETIECIKKLKESPTSHPRADLVW